MTATPDSPLLYSATMSLDGFIAGVGGDMSWLSDLMPALDESSGEPVHETAAQPEPGFDFQALMDSIGSLLIGNRTWGGDDPNKDTDAEGAFGGQWQGPSIVLSHHAAPDGLSADTIFHHDLDSAVAAAKAAAGGRYVNVLGADVARQCLEAGLLDEILVFIAPVLLGDGVRLFDHPGGTNVRLEPIHLDRTTVEGHWFRVRAHDHSGDTSADNSSADDNS